MCLSLETVVSFKLIHLDKYFFFIQIFTNLSTKNALDCSKDQSSDSVDLTHVYRNKLKPFIMNKT